MTTKTWVQVGSSLPIFSWRAPQNWTPTGTPQAGDNLIMVAGQMDIIDSKLPAELHLGPGVNQLATGPITLNLVSGGATLGVAGATPANHTYSNFNYGFTVNAYGDEGKDYLTADNLRMVQGDVNIVGVGERGPPTLVVTGKMEFAYSGHINGPGTLTNNGDIIIADGSISAHVNGHGTLEMNQYHDRVGVQTISGAVDKGQTVKLTFNTQDVRTELVHPETFKAKLDIAPGDYVSQSGKTATLLLDGIHAAEMDIRGDMLLLSLERGPPLWSVHEHMPAGMTASMTNTAAGTEIVFIPHPLVG